jgi:hypothetical protein
VSGTSPEMVDVVFLNHAQMQPQLCAKHIYTKGGTQTGGLRPILTNEADAGTFTRTNLAPETASYAGEPASWNVLHARHTLHRMNH